MKALNCASMKGKPCAELVARIDQSGFVYCEACGQVRKRYEPCRKLRPFELRRLMAGKPLTKY